MRWILSKDCAVAQGSLSEGQWSGSRLIVHALNPIPNQAARAPNRYRRKSLLQKSSPRDRALFRVVGVDELDYAFEVLPGHVARHNGRKVRLAGEHDVGEVAQFAMQADGLGQWPVELAVDRHHGERDLGQVELRARGARGRRRERRALLFLPLGQ